MAIPSYRSRQLMQISQCRLDTLTNIRLLHLMSEIQETLAFDPNSRWSVNFTESRTTFISREQESRMETFMNIRVNNFCFEP